MSKRTREVNEYVIEIEALLQNIRKAAVEVDKFDAEMVDETIGELKKVEAILVDAEMSIGMTLQHKDACPGCGNLPGDGIDEDCNDPDGCGHWKSYR